VIHHSNGITYDRDNIFWVIEDDDTNVYRIVLRSMAGYDENGTKKLLIVNQEWEDAVNDSNTSHILYKDD
jgi:hypothetical protein